MALLLAMFLAPCIGQAGPPREATSSSGAQAHDDSAWVAQAVDRLIRRNSADSLVAAAMLSRSGAGGLSSGHRRVQLLDRAAALQPLAADIAALLVRVCHDDDVAGCNMAAHVERLHRAAPDNAGYLRPALHRARQQHDSGKVTTILLAAHGAGIVVRKLLRPSAATHLARYPEHRPAATGGADGRATP